MSIANTTGKRIPSKLLLAFIAIYPIAPWYITFGPINLVNLISILFVVIWIASGCTKICSLSKTNAFFWAYLIVYSVQALVDSSITKSTAYIVSQLLVCIILYTELRKNRIFEDAIRVLTNVGICVGVYGIFEEVTRINIFHIISRLPEEYFFSEIRLGIFRIETAFSHPIVYGGYLCFIAALILYRISTTKDEKEIRLLRTGYIIVLINSLLTLSRSSLIILIIEQFIFLLNTRQVRAIKRIILYLSIISLVIILAIIAIPSFARIFQNIGYMFLSIFDDKYSSLYTIRFGRNVNAIGNRTDLYAWVRESIQGNEIFGVGTEHEFAYEVRSYNSAWGNYSWIKKSIENEYLYNLYLHGIVGLVSFILNIVGSVFYLYNEYRQSRKQKIGILSVYLYNTIIVIAGYALLLLSVSASDNVRMYNVIMCLTFAVCNNKRMIISNR